MNPIVSRAFYGAADKALKYTKSRHTREAMQDTVKYVVNKPAVQEALLKAAISPAGEKVTGQVAKLLDRARELPVIGSRINQAFPKPEPIDPAAFEAMLPDLREMLADAKHVKLDWGE